MVPYTVKNLSIRPDFTYHPQYALKATHGAKSQGALLVVIY